MTAVTLVRSDDRAAVADTIAQHWDDGHAVWVVDPTSSPRRLAELGGGVLRPEVVDRLVATGTTTVDLAVGPDTATIVTSSGTTGQPKVVCLSRGAMDASGRGAHRHLGVDHTDRWLLVLPLHHVAAQSVVWRARMLGRDPLVQPRLDVTAANAAGVTIASLVPTQLRRMVATHQRLDAHVLLGGAAISPDLLAAARAADTVDGITRSYGLTETCGGCVYDGVAFDGVEVVARDGLLALRGPVLATGLLTTHGLVPIGDRDGWLQTDDIGAVADDGTVSVTGRGDDVVITGGVNVNPAGVEVVLEDHPVVVRAGVAGLADDDWGQQVVAAVVLADGVAALPLRDLQDHVRTQLGGPAVPRRIMVVDELPLTGLGKLARRELDDLLRAALTPPRP